MIIITRHNIYYRITLFSTKTQLVRSLCKVGENYSKHLKSITTKHLFISRHVDYIKLLLRGILILENYHKILVRKRFDWSKYIIVVKKYNEICNLKCSKGNPATLWRNETLYFLKINVSRSNLDIIASGLIFFEKF